MSWYLMNSANYWAPHHAIFSSFMFLFISLSRDKLFQHPLLKRPSSERHCFIPIKTSGITDVYILIFKFYGRTGRKTILKLKITSISAASLLNLFVRVTFIHYTRSKTGYKKFKKCISSLSVIIFFYIPVTKLCILISRVKDTTKQAVRDQDIWPND